MPKYNLSKNCHGILWKDTQCVRLSITVSWKAYQRAVHINLGFLASHLIFLQLIRSSNVTSWLLMFVSGGKNLHQQMHMYGSE